MSTVGVKEIAAASADTVLGTAATTSLIAVNNSASSKIDKAGDQDWWKVTLSAGTTYTFKLNAASGSSLDAYLRLLNSAGTQLQANNNISSSVKNSLISFTATTSGTYYLSAQGSGSSTGAYTVSVAATDTVLGTTSTKSSVAVNGSASSTVDFSGDQDWWKVTLSAGTTYTFKLNAASGSSLDAYLRLLNSSGTQLQANNNTSSSVKNSLISFTATTSGTYYLSAQGSGSSTGAYTVSIAATDTVLGTTSTKSSVAVNGSASSTVDFSGDQDWWKVTLSAGTTYTFKLNAASGSSLDAYLRLLNSSGTQLQANNNISSSVKNSLISFTATTSGTYYLSAQGSGSSTGAYTVSVAATDTVLGTTSTKSSVAVNGSASSTVDFSGDQDWWKVTLSAGTTYTFKLNAASGSSLDAYLRLLNSAGTQLQANNNTSSSVKNSLISFTATTSGTYYLSAQGSGSSTGAYTVSVAATDTVLGTTSTQSSVAVNGSASSTVDFSGDQDWWKVTLSAGTTYTFKLNAASGSSLDAYLRLLNSSGTQLQANNNTSSSVKNSLISFTATTSGTYYLSAQGSGSSTGAYTVSVAATDTVLGTTSTKSSVAVNGSASSTVDFSGDQDWWKVTLSAGTTYTFKLNAASGSSLDAYLRLLNSAGTQLQANNNISSSVKNSLISFTATTSGTYYLSAQGSGSSTGAYTVSVAATDTVLGTTSTQSSVAVNGSASSTVDFSGDQDWWKVTLSAGTTYTFKLNAASGSSLDAYLRLLNSSGTQLQVSDNASSSTQNSLISFTATTSGTYYLSAQGSGSSTGAYTVSVAATDTVLGTTSTQSSVAVNGSASSTVDFSGDQDWWKVTLSAGTTYAMWVTAATGSSLDAYLRLLDSSGTVLRLNNDAASGTKNAQVTYTATTNGTYYLSAQGNGNSTGAYTLIVSATDTVLGTTATTANISINGTSSSSIDTTTDQDWWKVTLSAGTSYTFQLNAQTGSILDSYLRLLNSSSTQVSVNDNASANTKNSQITFTATASGTYYLSAQGTNGSTGTYTLTAVATDSILGTVATAAAAAVNTSKTSTVDFAGDQDWWKVTLSAGTTYAFKLNSLTGSTLDTALRLLNSSGSALASNSDISSSNKNSQITFKVTTSGTYYLSAQGDNNTCGAYTLFTTTDLIEDSRSTTSTQAINATASTSTVDYVNDQDWWAVTLTAGKTYVLQLSATTGSQLDSYLRLFNSLGNLLESNDNSSAGTKSSQITYTPTTSGTYYLSAQGYNNSTGNYAIFATTDLISASTQTTSNLTTANLVKSSTIDYDGDQDWWKINLTTGTTYIFSIDPATGSDLNTYLRLLNSTGTLVQVYNPSDRKDAEFIYEATGTGTYYLSVQGASSTSGDYSITFNTDEIRGSSATTTVLSTASGTTNTSTIDYTSDQDWWKVTLTAGKIYTFRLGADEDSGLDSYLRLINQTGTVLATNNDDALSTSSTDSRITFTATYSGTYYVSAQGNSNTVGAYTLSVGSDAIDSSINTTASLTVNGSAGSSLIDESEDQDWWRVRLTAGSTYTFRLNAESSSSLDPYLRLLSSTGQQLTTNDDASSATHNSVVSYKATTTGYYYLSAQGSGTTFGSYSIVAIGDAIAGSTDTTTTLTVDSTGESLIDTGGDQDWWKISLTAGTAYEFQLIAKTGSSIDAYLRLLNSSGTQITFNDDNGLSTDSLLVYTPSKTGTYYLSAQSRDGLGYYIISAMGSDAIPGTVESTVTLDVNGVTGASVIDMSTDQDWWKITLTAGATYTFLMRPQTSSSLDPYLRLLDSSGGVLVSNNDRNGSTVNAYIEYTATTSGTYFLSAQSNSAATSSDALSGMYTLKASSVDIIAGSSATTASLVISGAEGSSMVDSSTDQDWWKITLTAGASYTFRMSATADSALDAYLRLLNSSGTVLQSNDDSGGGKNSSITYTAKTSGVYYLSAQGYGASTGAYVIAATSAASDSIPSSRATTAVITVDGTPGSSTIDASADQDWWKISVVSGTTYTFDLKATDSSSLDAYLRLLDNSGLLLTYNDDNDSSDDAQIIYTATQTTTYYLSAQGYGSSTGAYTLSATTSSADTIAGSTSTTSTLTVNGDAGSSTVDIEGDQDWWKVRLKVGVTYVMRLTAATDSTLDAYLRLMNSAGTQVTYNDDLSDSNKNSRITYTASSTGTYYLSAQGYKSTGAYTIAVVSSSSASLAEAAGEDSTPDAEVFSFTSTRSGVTTISDFDSGTDRIDVTSSNFGGLKVGALSSANFQSASSTLTSRAAVFLYDNTTGSLAFDADGAGAGAAVQIAQLTGARTLRASDIFVVNG